MKKCYYQSPTVETICLHLECNFLVNGSNKLPSAIIDDDDEILTPKPLWP